MWVAILGDTAGNGQLERLGFQVRSNDRPQPGDPVLLAVSGRAGPVAPFVEGLNRATGYQADHVGLLLTEVGPGLDEELALLTEQEARFLLDAVEVFPRDIAHRLPCFRTDDPTLGERLAAWVASPGEPLRFMHAELLPDW